MNVNKIIYLIFIAIPLLSATPLQKSVPGTTQSISSNPELKKLVLSSAEKIYNFQFSEGEKIALQLKMKAPEGHPVYDMLMGISKVWQWEPTMVNKGLKKDAITHLENASRLAGSFIVKNKKDDLDAMFIYFSANGFLARIHSFSGEFFQAVQYATRAYQYVKKGQFLKEKFPDFYFSTGMYNYYREMFPEYYPGVKPFIGMLEKGNKSLGLEQLKKAYQQGLFAKIEAANYLANIYLKYEAQPSAVEPFLAEIIPSYQGNLFLQVKYGETLLFGKKYPELIKVVNRLFKSEDPYYNMAGFTFMARYYLNDVRYQDAMDALTIAKKYYDKIPGLVDNMPGYYHEAWAMYYQVKKDKANARLHYQLMEKKSEYPWYRKMAHLRMKDL